MRADVRVPVTHEPAQVSNQQDIGALVNLPRVMMARLFA